MTCNRDCMNCRYAITVYSSSSCKGEGGIMCNEDCEHCSFSFKRKYRTLCGYGKVFCGNGDFYSRERSPRLLKERKLT